MTTIEELKAQLSTQLTDVVAKAKEKADIAGLQARIAVLSSEGYQNALVAEQTERTKHELLTGLIAQCASIIEDNPIADKLTRQSKRWNGKPVYGLGKDIELLHTLCTGLLYSVESHKLLMASVATINLNTVEQFIESLGTTAYYNVPYKAIVDEVAPNVETLNHAVLLLGEQLGITLNASKLTTASLTNRSNKAYAKAVSTQDEHNRVPTTDFTMD